MGATTRRKTSRHCRKNLPVDPGGEEVRDVGGSGENGGGGESNGASSVHVRPPGQVPTRHIQHLRGAVHAINQQNKKENTAKAYKRKQEFFEYCNHQYGHEPLSSRYTVDGAKMFEFLFYQAFRNQYARGRRGRKRHGFNTVDFDEVMKKYNKVSPLVEMPEPDNPVGWDSINTYKSSVLDVYDHQVSKSCNSHAINHVFNKDCKDLVKLVKERRGRIARKNDKEKVDGNIAPYAVVQKIEEIEKSLWNASTTPRSAVSGLRNRYTFLQTKNGVLRCKSPQYAELSDMLGLEIRKPVDTQSIYVLIMQLSEGKTNNGVKVYGRTVRHKDVRQCPIGALAFYLFYRFIVSGEMNPCPDFSKNKEWFDIKLLTDGSRSNCVVMSTDSYGNGMRKVWKDVGVPTKHFVHIGRVLGPADLEFKEVRPEGIRVLRNWDPKTQEVRYSTKIPVSTMRIAAGFDEKEPYYILGHQ